jgi:hypothetical protein
MVPKKCCHCDQDETIQHLSSSFPLVKVVWRIVHVAFNLSSPKSINNLFGNWLVGVTKKEQA